MENASDNFIRNLKKEKQKLLQKLQDAKRARQQPDSNSSKQPELNINVEKETENSKGDQKVSKEFISSPTEKCETIDVKKFISLSIVRLPSMSIKPNETSTYDKQTQIENSSEDEMDFDYDRSDNESVSNDIKHETVEKVQRENHIEIKRQNYYDFEKTRILMDEKFQKFVDHASKVTQRVLYIEKNQSNPFIDYTESEPKSECHNENNDKILFNKCLYNSKLCENRVVTSFDCCSQYNELLLTTYYKNENLSNDFDGLCLIWNLKYSNETPEFRFNCDSPVMSGCFAKYSPNLIIGGTYSGQIVIWDNRSRRLSPVLISSVSPLAHTHPVYCTEVVGSSNVYHLVSVSNDGKMCSWDLNMLTKPVDSVDLVHQTISSSLSLKLYQPVLASSMSFPFDNCNNPVIGSENGKIYSVQRNTSDIQRVFEGHEEYVTKVECHPSLESSHLFLTSSLDWTIKLWTLGETEPLFTFSDNRDSVYDLKWSPYSSALFASVNGLGNIDIWDLNEDFHRPSATVTVDESSALNKITWTASGKQVITGDSNGKVWIYNIEDSFTDNSIKLNDILYEMKSDQFEQSIS